jgi:hypothetical protein
MLADIQRDLQRIFDEFTGLKDLDEHFKVKVTFKPQLNNLCIILLCTLRL